MKSNWQSAGVVIGLVVALLGAAGLVIGILPRISAGLIAIVAIGVIVGTRRRAMRSSAQN